MSHIHSIIEIYEKETKTYAEKTQIVALMRNNLGGKSTKLSDADVAELNDFIVTELGKLPAEAEKCTCFREKETVIVFGNELFKLSKRLDTLDTLPPEKRVVFAEFTALFKRLHRVYTALAELFKTEQIGRGDMERVIALVSCIDDEYERGCFFKCLLPIGEDKVEMLSDDVWKAIAEHTESELKRFLAKGELDRDVRETVVEISRVTSVHPSEGVVKTLQEFLKLGDHEINFSIVAMLVLIGAKSIPKDVITALAEDPEYASPLQNLLQMENRQELFPKQFSDPVYLAKSDMVQWLCYPTELGKAPDEIEFLGKIRYFFKRETFYVFKFRSNSDTLDEESKNKWLIGWSQKDGGTFSNFDLLSRYEGKTVKETLKNIRKRLIG